jgi:hypothetical protein
MTRLASSRNPPLPVRAAPPHTSSKTRCLVSGHEGLVWACGFTLTYDTALAGHWAELLGA